MESDPRYGMSKITSVDNVSLMPRSYEQGRADGLREAFEAACKAVDCPECCFPDEEPHYPHSRSCEDIRRAAKELDIDLSAAPAQRKVKG